MKQLSYSILLFFLVIRISFANSPTNFDLDLSQKNTSFIENLGQFDEFKTSSTGEIRYAVDFGGTKIFFGEKGISYNFLEATKKSKAERAEILASESASFEDHKRKENLVGKFLFKADEVGMEWLGVNPNMFIETTAVCEDYHSYYFKNTNGEYQEQNHIKSFKEITYKNIYQGIDLTYTIHPVSGVKYAFIVHPGADPTTIKMLYDKEVKLTNGKILISTVFGAIIDHAPVTFYENERENLVSSSFSLNKRLVQFELGKYDETKTLVIDPWTQTPAFNLNWDVVWECDRDAAGNVYVIGGVMPMQLLKYNAAGALQWTYNTPYDTSNAWLGTLATDLAGNSYITAGSIAKIQKVNTSAAVVWSNNSPGGILSSAEFWSISFNCDQSSLVIGGTGGPLLGLDARIFNVNVNTGNISSQIKVAVGTMIGIPPALEEVRGVCSNDNGKYYFFTHDTIGYIYDDFTFCQSANLGLTKTNHGMGLGYKCENFRQDNCGIKAIRSDGNFLYVNKGNQLQKRSLVDFSIIATVSIPGGGFNNVFLSGNAVSNSGIDVDQCGNVYVGSASQVVKYDANLNQLATYPVSYNVYDVRVSINGDVIACGGTGTSSSATRNGGVSSINANACAPLLITCCEPNICNPGVLCVTDPSISLSVATPGGVFSGPGVDASGTFNPASVGTGFHTIIYTLPCGSDSIVIAVSSCMSLVVCQEANGDLTVSGGTGPFTWARWQAASSTPISNQASCQACGYTWFFGTCLNGVTPVTSCSAPAQWVNYINGTTVAPPSTYPLRVTDATGNEATYNAAVNIPLCDTLTCPTISLSIDTFSNVTCNGLTNGTATVSSSGGNGVVTYSWMPGNLTGQSRSNLAPNTYTVTVTDSAGCTGMSTVVITQPAPLSINSIGSVNETCQNQGNGSISSNASGGTGALSYLWQLGSLSGANQANLSPGTYLLTVTDGNGCTDTDSAIVQAGPNCCSLSLSAVVTNSSCGNNDGGIDIAVVNNIGAPTFQWSTLATTEDLSNVGAGTYTLICEDTAALTFCQIDTSFSIIDNGAPSMDSIITNNPSCAGLCDGTVEVFVSGGTPPYSYEWFDANDNSIGVDTSFLSNLCGDSIYLIVNDSSGGSSIINSNTSFESGPAGNCACPTGYTCSNDAGLVVDGIQPVYVAGNQGCITQATNYTSSLGANTGTGYVYFYAGADNVIASPSYNFVGGEQIQICVEYSGPQGAGASGQNTINAFFAFDLNGIQVGPNVLVPTNTPWTQHCFSVTMTTGNFTFGIISGGAAQYSIWFDDFVVSQTTSGSSCPITFPLSLVDPTSEDPSFSFADFCVGASNSPSAITSPGGQFDFSTLPLDGATINAVTGVILNATSGTSYSVRYTTGGTCAEDSISIVTANGLSLDSIVANNETCQGLSDGSISISVSGGTGNVVYTWMPGNLNGATQSNLSPGMYVVSITDSTNCSYTDSIEVLVGPNCCPLTLSALITNATCGNTDGSINLTLSNGTGPYSFAWSNSTTTEDLVNVAANNYFISIIDSGAVNCQVDTNFTIISSNGPAIDSLSAVAETCIGDADGSVFVSASGGTGNLVYTWMPGNLTGGAQSNLSPGMYAVNITDSINCSIMDSVEVLVGPNCCLLTMSAIITNATCGNADGSINLTLSNGTGPYSFAWSNAADTEDLVNLVSNNYIVSIIDNGAVNCQIDTNFNILSANGPNINSITAVAETCVGDGDGSISVAASGGTGNLVYTWNPGNLSGATQSNLSPDTYLVTITDSINCVVIDSVAVLAGPTCCNLSFISLSSVDENCSASDGSASVVVNSIAPSISYVWSNSATGAAINNLTAGSYTVTVIDNSFANCSIDTVLLITNTMPPSIDAIILADVSCDGLADGAAEAIVSGGTPPYTFIWSSSLNATAIESGLDAGTYTLTVSDVNCTVSQDFTISEGLAVTINAGNDTLINLGDSVLLQPIVTGSNSGTYAWQPSIGLSCTTCPNPLAGPEGELIYTVVYQDALTGCEANDALTIGLIPIDPYCAFPNAFSPNLDAVNDYFRSICERAVRIDFKIYNRWGELVYSELADNNFLVGWDGFYKSKAAPIDVYVYAAEVTFEDGLTEAYSGNVTLVR